MRASHGATLKVWGFVDQGNHAGAKRVLREWWSGDGPDARQVLQIADDIGFKRAGDFATAFRLGFGMTPREYRKRDG